MIMNDKKYIGVYYPDTIISDIKSLTTFCIFFDEVHLVTITDGAKDPTNYLKNLPDKFYLNVFGNGPEKNVERVKNYYQFALRNRELLKEVLYYHPHLFDISTNMFLGKLFKGSMPAEDFYDFFLGNTPELKKYANFRKNFPEITDEVILRTASTALSLSKERGWVLLSDKPNIPVPILSEKNKTVKELTSILAEECIKVAIPRCEGLCAEDILIAREKLKDLLIPFRMTMQKLSMQLKNSIESSTDYFSIKNEAKFIAESQVEPAIYEIRRKIELEKDKLWLKIFGKIISWIPLIAKSFIVPSTSDTIKLMEKISGDVGDFVSGSSNIDIAREPGISFLLDVHNVIK